MTQKYKYKICGKIGLQPLENYADSEEELTKIISSWTRVAREVDQVSKLKFIVEVE